MTEREFRRRFPNASQATVHANCPDYRPTSAELEQGAGHESVGSAPAKEADPTIRSVRVTSRRIRLLDTDNLAIKYHIDALCYEGVLKGDSPKHITLEVRQEKVRTAAEECTVIEIN